MYTHARRRQVALATLVAALFSMPATAAQAPEEEIARLRQFLKVPETTTLQVADAPALPAETPLKLFIATGLDLGVRQNFVRWVDDWNQKHGKKRGVVLMVKSADAADVILARYTERDKQTTSTDTALGNGVVYDPGTQQLKAAPYAREYSYTEVPVFGYIVTRTAPTTLEIAWRYAATTTVHDTGVSGQQLWKDFESLMKGRRQK